MDASIISGLKSIDKDLNNGLAELQQANYGLGFKHIVEAYQKVSLLLQAFNDDLNKMERKVIDCVNIDEKSADKSINSNED